MVGPHKLFMLYPNLGFIVCQYIFIVISGEEG
jgi:hypothetical protein